MWHADVHEFCRSVLEPMHALGNTSHASCLQRLRVRPEVRQSVQALTCLSAPRTDSQTDNLSSDRAGGERNSITPHRTPPHPPPTPISQYRPPLLSSPVYHFLHSPSSSLQVASFQMHSYIFSIFMYEFPSSSSSLLPCVHPSLPFFVFSLALSLPPMLGFSYTSCLPLPFFFTLSIPLL